MKSIIKGIILGLFIAIIFSPLTVHAETRQEKWLREQKESDEEFLNKIEKDGNLTEEAINALGRGNNKKANKKDKINKENKNNNQSVSESKGWVYSTDELHIIGLPEDESGYTKAGDYGVIYKGVK